MNGVKIVNAVSILVIALCINFLFSVAQERNSPTRNDLRITGGVCRVPGEDGCLGIDTRGQSNPMLFHKLGRTVPELIRNHWRPYYAGQSCDHGGRFNGFQWIDPRQPPSVTLLFDIQGTVAGMQFWVPYRDTRMPGQNYQYHKQPMMQNATVFGFEYFYVTVYFMEPGLICSQGRPSGALEKEGTIRKFYVQNGPTPSHSKRLPLTRAAALREGWAPNNCFRGMGWHSFYDQNKWDSDGCTTFQPLVTFFDHSGNLNGYAFFTIGRATAHFLETPAPWMTEWIAGKFNSTDLTPKCLMEVHKAFGISGLHVYLTERPYEFSCNAPSSNSL